MKGYKAKSQKGKARGVKSGGSQASRTRLPVESHSARFSLSAVTADNRYYWASAREAVGRSVPGSYWEEVA